MSVEVFFLDGGDVPGGFCLLVDEEALELLPRHCLLQQHLVGVDLGLRVGFEQGQQLLLAVYDLREFLKLPVVEAFAYFSILDLEENFLQRGP